MTDHRTQILRDESIPQLLRQLSGETTTLMRQEIELAKTEVNGKITALTAGARDFSIAAVFGIGAFAALTVAFIAALALVLPVWCAALITTVLYAVVAFVAFSRGRSDVSKASPLVPQQTAQTVKDDIEWVKTRTPSSSK